jgi:hypothetical protein
MSRDTVEVYVYDPNYPNGDDLCIQFENRDVTRWFQPTYGRSGKPLYAFFAADDSHKEPPEF